MSASRDLQTRVVAAFLIEHNFPFTDNNTTQYVNQWFKLDGEAARELRQFIQLMFGADKRHAKVVVRKSYVSPDYYSINHPELYTLIKESRDEHS